MKKEEDSLTIFGVAERDQGSYTCVASTELDQDLAKAYLTVLGKRRLLPRRCPPHLPLSREVGVALRAAPAVSQPARRGEPLI